MSSVDEIASLVQTLYSPNQDKDLILSVQQQLQSIQKRPDAPELAHELLKYNVQTIQFFGALTYTVYLFNHPIDTQIGDVMIGELVEACSRNLDSVVIQKLLFNIAKIYTNILYFPINDLFQKLSSKGLDMITISKYGLLACKTIGEELNRCEKITAEKNQMIMDSMLEDNTKNLLNNTTHLVLEDSSLKKVWLDCLQAWMIYVSKSSFEFHVKSDLNEYYRITLMLLQKLDIDALDLISEIFDVCPSQLNNDNKSFFRSLVFSEWTTNFITNNDIDDNSKLSKLIASSLDSEILTFASKLIDSEYQQRIEFLLFLTNQPGDPITDEPFSVDMLEFWTLFAEAFINDTEAIHTLIGNEEAKIQTLHKISKTYFIKLSAIYWEKCKLIDGFDEYEDEFLNFRRDIGELFESLFTIARSEVFNNLSNSVSSSLLNERCSNDQIKNADTSLYLLTVISSIVGETENDTNLFYDLNCLFESKFLVRIASLPLSSDLDNKLYQYLVKDSIKFISEINWFYQTPSGLSHVNDVLMFLFKYLEDSNFQDSASRAILSITDTCRSDLTSLLNDFELAATSIIKNIDVDTNVRTRIIRSYSSILQTVANLRLQAEKISKFLDLIYTESIGAYGSIETTAGNADILEKIDAFLVSMVSSLVGLARGLEIPEDWEKYYEDDPDKMKLSYEYWKFQDQHKFQVHDKCLKLVLLFTFPSYHFSNLSTKRNLNPEIVEQVYNLLRSGLSEPIPGPFVIDYFEIIKLIIKVFQYCQTNETSNVDPPIIKFIQLYGILVKSNYTSSTITKITGLQVGIDDLHMSEVIDVLLFQNFDSITEDTDVLQYIFTLLGDIITCYPTELIQNPGFVRIMEIFIDQIYRNCQQRFVVISLSKFASNLIYLRKGKLEDVEFMNHLLVDKNIGEILVLNLMRGFINTSRSLIEFYVDILRALTSKYGKYLRVWIENAFLRINEENMTKNAKIVDQKVVEGFIKQLLVTRGQRVANRIIKEFWYTVTGMVDYGM